MMKNLLTSRTQTFQVKRPKGTHFEVLKCFTTDNPEISIEFISENFKMDFLGLKNVNEVVPANSEFLLNDAPETRFTYRDPEIFASPQQIFNAIAGIQHTYPLSRLWHIYELMKLDKKLDSIGFRDFWFVDEPNYFFVQNANSQTKEVWLERGKTGWHVWSMDFTASNSHDAYSRVFFGIESPFII